MRYSFPAYPRHASFHAVASDRNELWRTVLAAALVALGFLIFTLLAGVLIGLAAFISGRQMSVSGFLQAAQTGRSGTGVISFLLFNALIGPPTILVARFLTARGLSSLVGGTAALRRHDFLRSAAATVAVFAALMPLVTASDVVWRHLPVPEWLGWLPFALPAIWLQTGAEEILFRGFLQQQLASRFRSPWIWMVLPSALFGCLHLPNAGYPWGMLYAVWAAVLGLLAADLTARTGSIAAGWGLHFGTNLCTVLLVGNIGFADGLALFNHVLDPRDSLLILVHFIRSFGLTAVYWLAVRLALRV